MAIDLDNAIGQVALSLGGNLSPDALPWSGTLGPASVQAIRVSQDLFHALFALALVVALVILVLTYVVRAALLEILVVLAPLAALCTVLPDTRGYAKMWLRLFMVTVFMQAVQLIVLRVATATGFGAGDGLAGSLYALATLWIMLKVPGTMHAATNSSRRRTRWAGMSSARCVARWHRCTMRCITGSWRDPRHRRVPGGGRRAAHRRHGRRRCGARRHRERCGVREAGARRPRPAGFRLHRRAHR